VGRAVGWGSWRCGGGPGGWFGVVGERWARRLVGGRGTAVVPMVASGADREGGAGEEASAKTRGADVVHSVGWE